MQINQLPVIPQAPADADVLAIEVNGITYKVSKSALASAILGTIDTTPTQSSTRLVQSGGVYNAIQQSTASKADKFVVSDMEGTSSNMTIVRQKITRSGSLVVVQVVLSANSTISKNTEIMKLPYYHDNTSYYPIYAYCQDRGNVHLLLLSGTKLTYFDELGLSSGQRLSFEYAYINT